MAHTTVEMSGEVTAGDQPPQVHPAPVPSGFTIGTVRADDGSPLVVLQVQTPVGVAVYFLERDFAIQVGNALRREGKAASPLVTPPNGLVVPGRP